MIRGDIKDFQMVGHNLYIMVQFFKDNVILVTGEPNNYDRILLETKLLKGMTNAQRLQYLKDIVLERCEQIVTVEYKNLKPHPAVDNQEVLSQALFDLMEVNRSVVEAVTQETDTTEILLDTNDDGVFNKKAIIKDDGTKTVENI